MHLKTAWLKAAALMLLLAAAASAPARQAFVVPTTRDGTVEVDTSTTVVRAVHVLVDIKQLAAGSRSLRLIIFDRRTLNLTLDRIEPIPHKGLIWYGKVAKEPRSSAVLALVGQTVSGNIDTEAGRAYQIRYVGGGVHSFREIDRTKFPNEGTPLLGDVKLLQTPFAPGVCATDPPTEIDALVVYTPAARSAAGGQDAMEGTVYLALADTNESYLNSNIDQRLRLAHVEEVNYIETGMLGTDLASLQGGSGGLASVHALRDTFAADTVTLITEGGDSCGQGYYMSGVSQSFESYAYSVVPRACATGSYSFAHELGHNMGADHDVPHEFAPGAYPYNHGFFNTSPTAPATPWRTIMAEEGSLPSARVKYFSNPSVNDSGGDPMGDTATADNHQVLNNTALTVANFRCSSPSVGNVWMKDTWNDTGLEPDPHTAGEDMWKSPYIWVRNMQDTGLVHQHEHQNPVFGAPNWVYVKMHNGGSTATQGNLEVYWANASISLTWPGSWTLLSSVPVSGFGSHSTTVVGALERLARYRTLLSCCPLELGGRSDGDARGSRHQWQCTGEQQPGLAQPPHCQRCGGER